MKYTATTWENGVTPINETNLNKLEQGVANLDVKNTKTETGTNIQISDSVYDTANLTANANSIIIITGKNLFNKKTITRNKSITSTGSISDTSEVCYSDYIRVIPNSKIIFSGKSTWNTTALYDNSKTFIERKTGASLTLPNDCYYIRTNALIAEIDNIQCEFGETATTKEEYQEQRYNILSGDVKQVNTYTGITNILSTGNITIQYNSQDRLLNNNDIKNTNNKIQESNKYNLEETIIGYWINGKPIYRKVIDCGNLPNNSSKNVAHGITNYDDVIKLEGVIRYSTYRFPIPSVPGTTSQGTLGLMMGGTNITLRTTTDMTSWTAYVIIEYTKTTD